MTREVWVQKSELNYVGLNLTGLTYVGTAIDTNKPDELCQNEQGGTTGAEFYNGLCICPQHTFYNLQKHTCTPGSTGLNWDNRQLIFEYTYKDKLLLYKAYPISQDTCTDEQQVGGYLVETAKCVIRCAGRYTTDEDGNCVCAVQSSAAMCSLTCEGNLKELGNTCVCNDGYVLTNDRGDCKPRTSCDRIEIVDHEEVCMAATQCAGEYRLSTKNKLCVKSCPQAEVDVETDELKCVPECPESAPVVDSNQVCQTCLTLYPGNLEIGDLGRPYWDRTTHSCVPSCKIVQVLSSSICQPCDQGQSNQKLFWDPMAEDCIDKCSVGKDPDYGDICPICKDVFPPNPVTGDPGKPFWNRGTKTCVASDQCGEWMKGSLLQGYCVCVSMEMTQDPGVNYCRPSGGSWDKPGQKKCVAEGECGDNQVGYKGKCTCATGFSLDKKNMKCVEGNECDNDQYNIDVKCVCKKNLYFDITGEKCVAAGDCGLYQEVKSGMDECTCKGDLEYDAVARRCIPPGNNWKKIQNICAAEGRSTSLKYDRCFENCRGNSQTSIDNHCVCAQNYAIGSDKSGCIQKGAPGCRKTLMMESGNPSGETCTSLLMCDPTEYKLARDARLCIPLTQFEGCRFVNQLSSGELSCVRKCEIQYYKDIGARRCVPAQDFVPQPKTVSVLGSSYQYWQRNARSYAAFDLKYDSDQKKAAYFEATGVIVALQLRATGYANPPYAPAIFFSATSLLGCDFQLTAGMPVGSAVLAVWLLTSPRLVGCHLFSSFWKDLEYGTAIYANGHIVTVEDSVIDLDGALDEAFQKLGGNVESPRDRIL